MSFKEDVEAAKTAAPSLVVPVEVNGKRYRLKFSKLPGTEYAAETMLHDADLDSSFGREFGYDILALSRAVAPRCGVLLDGKAEETLEPEVWANLFVALDGGAQKKIANAIFQLNEFGSAAEVAAAKKLLDGIAVSSLLRSVLGSPPAGSTGGSPASSTSTSTTETASSAQ